MAAIAVVARGGGGVVVVVGLGEAWWGGEVGGGQGAGPCVGGACFAHCFGLAVVVIGISSCICLVQ